MHYKIKFTPQKNSVILDHVCDSKQSRKSCPRLAHVDSRSLVHVDNNQSTRILGAYSTRGWDPAHGDITRPTPVHRIIYGCRDIRSHVYVDRNQNTGILTA